MSDAPLQHHSCPVCRCKWNPRESKTQIESVNGNVQRMAREIRALRQRRLPR
jgi:hypothetical protein